PSAPPEPFPEPLPMVVPAEPQPRTVAARAKPKPIARMFAPPAGKVRRDGGRSNEWALGVDSQAYRRKAVLSSSGFPRPPGGVAGLKQMAFAVLPQQLSAPLGLPVRTSLHSFLSRGGSCAEGAALR